jgi:hypothetical protein
MLLWIVDVGDKKAGTAMIGNITQRNADVMPSGLDKASVKHKLFKAAARTVRLVADRT